MWAACTTNAGMRMYTCSERTKKKARKALEAAALGASRGDAGHEESGTLGSGALGRSERHWRRRMRVRDGG
eukprot:CAMPEP_0119370582 /NCGR_PEP_ID=MMETSP1334-20130426/16935_1 /TAXON_ID=127549 /ORGANISM="Calcidiscus leptoporus, Strain RCC1130" /LENGTH=70 /DNA_ID=CAMNT_0007387675 /DNA_START=366 /DNA_END=579 /DNA_ORIENTATION=+